MSNLTDTVHPSFARYLAGSVRNKNSIALQFAARLSTLTHFEGDFIGQLINLTWNFLIWHQLVYQAVALKHPAVVALNGVKPQSIRQAVNQDLQRCFATALHRHVSPDQVSRLKVCTPHLCTLILRSRARGSSPVSVQGSLPSSPPMLLTKLRSRKPMITPSLPPP